MMDILEIWTLVPVHESNDSIVTSHDLRNLKMIIMIMKHAHKWNMCEFLAATLSRNILEPPRLFSLSQTIEDFCHLNGTFLWIAINYTTGLHNLYGIIICYFLVSWCYFFYECLHFFKCLHVRGPSTAN